MISNVNTELPGRTEYTEGAECTEVLEGTEFSIRRNSDTSVTSVSSVTSDTSVNSVHSVLSVSGAVHAAASRCVPVDKRSVGRALFRFAREMRSLFPGSESSEVTEYVDVWWERAQEVVPDLELPDAVMDFMEKWDAVKFPAGEDPLELVLEAVSKNPPPECSTRYGGKVGMLVHILQRLQIEVGDKAFYMSGRTAARLVGTTHGKASMWLRGLVKAKVLEVDHSVESNAHRARRYRYSGDYQ